MKKSDILDKIQEKYLKENPDFSLTNVEDKKVILSEIDSIISSLFEIKEDLSTGYQENRKLFISDYFKELSKLSNGEKAELKRSLGVKTDDFLSGLYRVYYKVPAFRTESMDNKELWALCGRIYCFMNGQNSKSLASCLKSVLNSETGRMKFEKFLNSDFSKYEYFSRDLISFIRQVKSKGMLFNCEKLLFDLLNWENGNKFVQQSWARDFYN